MCLRNILNTVICFCLGLQGLCANLADQDDSNMPSSSQLVNLTCSKHINSSETIHLKDYNDLISCSCSRNSTVFWLDKDCEVIGHDEKFSLENSTIKGFESGELNEELILYCTDAKSCSNEIIVLSEADKVLIGGISLGVQVFLGITIVLIVLLLCIFIYKKRKHQVYLCCRDLWQASNVNDGKEYDAYISVGKNTNDIKFVQRNVVDVLKRKYNYKFYIDDDNLLPQLDFSEKVQTKLDKCRRLVVIFTPAYMKNDWCTYCFSEGLRKLMELNIKMIFVISDVTIQKEINSFSSIVGHVPKLFVSFLPKTKKKQENDEIIQKMRLVLSPPCRSSNIRRGMRAPMLSEVEDIDERSLYENESSKDTKMSTLENTSMNEEEIDREKSREEAEYGFEDPNSIKVHQYKAKKNFYSFTAMPNE